MKLKSLAVAVPLAAAALTGLALRPLAAQDAAPPAAQAPADPAANLAGKPAPAFSLPDQNDKTRSLAENRGKWVVLAFYPADMTRGCTLQNKSYSAKASEFAPMNAVVYTVSTQDTKSKQEFCSKEGLTHTLLSDVGGKASAAYGVLNPNGYARRVTFYIAPDGTVASVDTKIKAATAAEDSLETLKMLAKNDPGATEGRKPLGGGSPVTTEKSPSQFVGPASAKVTMGALVPDFGLTDVATGKTVALTSLQAGKKATVILFIATQCPVSNAYTERMAQIARDYAPKGVAFVGINANKPEATAEVAAHAQKNGLAFPVLKDPDGAIANRFEASVTPEVYVTDDKGILVYHGAIDNSQDPSGVKTKYLASTLDALLAGQPVPAKMTKAFGCAIKR